MKFILDGKETELKISHVVNAGYAGSDQSTVQAHIRELAAIGVKGPERTPTFYPVPLLQFTQQEQLQVGHAQTSAEVEYVFLQVEGKRYLGIGSDHSDRALETYSVNAAKQMCPDIIGEEIWDYDKLRDHWSSLALRCEVLVEGSWCTYQQSPITALLTPEELLELGAAVMPDKREGLALFSGTIPLSAEIRYATSWRVSLHDAMTDKTLTKEYHIEVLPDCIE